MQSTYSEDIRNVKRASGQGKPRPLQHLDPPVPSVADEAPAPVDSPVQDPPVPACEATFAAWREGWCRRWPQGQEKEIVNWVALSKSPRQSLRKFCIMILEK